MVASAVRASRDAVLLDVLVTPNASRTEVRGTDPWRHGVRIRVAAKPTEGAANAELVRFLALRLRVPESALRIVAGRRSHRKTVAIAGLPREAVLDRLLPGDG